MRLYHRQHQFYCGIDLHARTMYLCILDADGTIVLHRNLTAEPAAFLKAIAPYRGDLVVCCACLFAWYWLADLCAQEGIAFVLGHALYMKAIYGAKTKNDKLDAEQIARLLRGQEDRAFTEALFWDIEPVRLVRRHVLSVVAQPGPPSL